jgi:hypothetical protein
MESAQKSPDCRNNWAFGNFLMLCEFEQSGVFVVFGKAYSVARDALLQGWRCFWGSLLLGKWTCGFGAWG